MNKNIVIIFFLSAIGLAIFLFYPFHGFLNTGLVVTPVSTPLFTNNPSPTKVPIVSVAPISSSITTTSTPNSTGSNIKVIKINVPFTSQAPFGEWSDPRQQNACEEASVLMAIYWANGQSFSLQEAKDKILAIADWEQKKYENYIDTSARDTVERLFKEYFQYQKAFVVENIVSQDIINELVKGNLVIVPANGQTLKNKFFQVPGPLEHMLVIIGYDYQTKEFITNDPGTRQGKDYRYNQDVLFNAIRDYPTGYHEPIVGIQKTMIVVQK